MTKKIKKKFLYCFCDGASSFSPPIGGYGYAFISKNKKVIKKYYGNENSTTNNRMELMAFYKGVRRANKIFEGLEKIVFYTDSEYLVKGYNEYMERWRENGWRTNSNKEVQNLDIWKKIYKVKETNEFKIKLKWVKGHQKADSKDWKAKFNKIADALAVRAKENLRSEKIQRSDDCEFNFETFINQLKRKYKRLSRETTNKSRSNQIADEAYKDMKVLIIEAKKEKLI